MQSLDALTRDAKALAEGGAAAAVTGDEQEFARQLQICNACRYCEGFCAVFPAMTRRLGFPSADLHYLANLCHSCGACLHACQYAPPHAFAITIPRTTARVRAQTWQQHAWPAPLGRLYQRNGLTLSLALALALALMLALVLMRHGSLMPGAEAATTTSRGFYAVLPHSSMVALFAPVFAFAVVSLAIGIRRFWRAITPVTSGVPLAPPAAAEAAHDAIRLRYLDGGHGDGCNEQDDAFTLARRRYHHLTFYGFLLCFAATCVATIYHYAFAQPAPYDLPSLPKLLGVVGGIGMTLGTTGLWRLRSQRHSLHVEPSQQAMDLGFIALLGLTAISGLTLWLARDTIGMPLLLCVHLGAVLALFLTMPYSKFAHGLYRLAALARYAVERRQPNPVAATGD